MPTVVVIGGPNGAGKSTLARLLFSAPFPFLNADQIAETLPPDGSSPEREAARLLLERWDALAVKRRCFAIETTLASRSLAPRLRPLRAEGWHIVLVFIASPHPDLNVARVACRVATGGHDIPEEVIRRRYAASHANFVTLYAPLADRSYVFRNDDISGPERIEQRGEPSGDPGFDSPEEMLRRFQIGVSEVLTDHRLYGRTVAVWRPLMPAPFAWRLRTARTRRGRRQV